MSLLRSAVRGILPPWLRYALTVLLFWPTIWLARALSWLAPWWRRPYDRVHEHVVLGGAPVLRADVARLAREERVGAVVNLCMEWPGHGARFYESLGLAQLALPTIDFDVPALAALLRGAAFIARHARAGRSVYVHCKAGRGRSTCVVLAFLVLFEGAAPRAAHDRIKKRRPHISSKFDAPEIEACWRLRRAIEAAGAAAADAFLAAAAEGARARIDGVAATEGGEITPLLPS